MKIALIGLTHPFRGGISHYSTLLCQALRERHEVRFYALRRQYPRLLFPGKTQTDDSQASQRVENEPSLDSINPLSWLATAGRIRRFRPDCIVVSWWHPFFAPAFGTVAHLSRLMGGIPSIFLCHNVFPHEASIVDRLLLRYAYSSARAFITHSRADAELLRRLRPRAAVHTHPHPTYAAFVPEQCPSAGEARTKLGLSDSSRVLLFFGFIRPYKGLEHLLEAMLALPPEEGYHLLVVGEFYEQRERYQAALDALQARRQLTLVDRYVRNEEIPLYFAAADLVVVPYLSATQSGIVQMAYGFLKPVIATAVGGLPEVVTEERTGYLVPPADAGAIAAAVRRHFAAHDGAALRRHILQANHEFSWAHMVETIEQTAAGLS